MAMLQAERGGTGQAARGNADPAELVGTPLFYTHEVLPGLVYRNGAATAEDTSRKARPLVRVPVEQVPYDRTLKLSNGLVTVSFGPADGWEVGRMDYDLRRALWTRWG